MQKIFFVVHVEILSMRKNPILLGLLVCTFIIFTLFIPNGHAADIDQRIILPANQYTLEKVSLFENESKSLDISTNQTIELYFLNETAAGEFLRSDDISAFYSLNISNSFKLNLSFNLLIEQYSLPVYNATTNNVGIRFYFLIINPNANDVSVVIRLNYENAFLLTLKDVSRMGLIVVVSIAVIFMFIKAYQFKQENELVRFKMLRGFAVGYTFGLINWLMWELDLWYYRLYHRPFVPQIEVQGPWFPFTFNLIQILYLFLYSLTQMCIIYETEKNISQKKYPYLSIFIVASGIGIGVGFFIPILFDFAFICYCFMMISGLAYFIKIYGSVATNSTGIIRWKAILIILGVMIPLLMGVTRGNMIPGQKNLSYILADLLSMLAFIFFYYGAI
jgi:hypothetical protein